MAKDVIVVVQRDALPNEKENLDILLVWTKWSMPELQSRSQGDYPAQSGKNYSCRNTRQQIQDCEL